MYIMFPNSMNAVSPFFHRMKRMILEITIKQCTDYS